MKFFQSLIFLCIGILSNAQSKFDQHDSLFNVALQSDLSGALKILKKQEGSIQSNTHRATFYLNQALYQFKINHLDSALVFSGKANGYIANTNEVAKADYYMIEALVKRSRGEYQASNAYLLDVVSSKHLKKVKSKALLLNIAVENYVSLEKLEEAKKIGLKVFHLLENTTDKECRSVKINNLLSLGNIMYFEAKYDSSMYYYYKVADLIPENDLQGLANCYGYMANVMHLKGDYQKAISFHKKGINCLRKTSMKVFLAHAYYNIALSYQEANKNDSSFIYLKKCKQLSTELSYSLMRGYSLLGLGEYYMNQADYQNAMMYCQRALSDFEQNDNTSGSCNALCILANAYAHKGNKEKALELGRKALVLGEELGTLDARKIVYETLFEVYEVFDLADSALFYFKKYTEINDSIRSVSVQENIDRIEITFSTKLKEKENKNLKLLLEKKRLEEKRASDRRAFWMYVSLLLILVFCAIVTVLFFMLKSRRHVLISKEKEIAHSNQLRKILHRTLEETKSKLIQSTEELQKLEHDSSVDSTAASQRLMDKIADHSDWTSFMAEFELIYAGFFQKARENSTDQFTNNDLKLLAFIKLGLSNKEISEYLFISVDSVKKSKTRLFSKFTLTENFSKISDQIRAI